MARQDRNVQRVSAEQKLSDGSFQNAHAVAVHDAHTIDGSERCRIQKLVHLFDGFLRTLADDV